MDTISSLQKMYVRTRLPVLKFAPLLLRLTNDVMSNFLVHLSLTTAVLWQLTSIDMLSGTALLAYDIGSKNGRRQTSNAMNIYEQVCVRGGAWCFFTLRQ